ncbi:LysR family transcriptional regulator [Roseomonas sp. NAR14]|uniref:LysR family transcriptional regulator n=1 Tax=Roseomonas acroporae TaxID=2937791 RepID=A0A9X1YAM7_9PROT|nr:LysR family transcriptional regulator [Roseomonas acroporae]MCK8786232.1 LysR family transcriptional regulator [Roseomonas acroporae]
MLDLVHLRSFATLAEELHFGRAARRLHMTQPPLSRQLQLLERELGVRLLDRGGQGVALTAAGRAFLPEARALLAAGETATQVARRAAQAKPGGALTIGLIGAAAYAFLPRLVSRARAELPDIALTLKEMMGAAQVEALALGRIDLGLARPLTRPFDGAAACVMREPLALALPEGHPLAARRRLALRDLEDVPFIMYSPDGPYLHALLTDAFRAAGVRPRVVQAMSHAQSILSLVSTGMGVAIVPAEARNACFGSVVFRPIRVAPGAMAELHAIWRPENRNPALPPFRALLRRVALPG